MNDSGSAIEVLKALFSISPLDEGGSEQRIGASFQDHVAAKYCIEMLSPDCQHQQVWCESHDDIVLVWCRSTWQCEYVQVKAGESQGPWSKSSLCTKNKNKQGIKKPCIVERSLQHDCIPFPLSFRLVTRVNTNEELAVLKAPPDSPGRAAAIKELKSIVSYLDKKITPFKSPNGNAAEFWVRHTTIQVLGDEHNIKNYNLLRLLQFVEQQGITLRTELREIIYERILDKIQEASRTRWSDNPTGKVITAEDFIQFVRDQLLRGKNWQVGDHERLRAKMLRADLGSVEIEAATELRRRYLNEVYEPKYFDLENRELVEGEILARLHYLRARRNSKLQSQSDMEFHAQCLEEIRELKSVAPDDAPEFVLLGCMYEVTARCRHKFHRGD
jgi:hypothetical protein